MALYSDWHLLLGVNDVSLYNVYLFTSSKVISYERAIDCVINLVHKLALGVCAMCIATSDLNPSLGLPYFKAEDPPSSNYHQLS